jgi:hypothetical protein
VQDVPGAKQAWATLLLRLPDRLPSVSARRAVLATLLTDRAERTFEPSGLEVEHQSAGIGQASFEGIEVSGPVALVPAALAETLRELARLRDRGPSRVDADSARWNAARQVAYGHDSLPGATLGLLGLASSGLPLDTWNGFAAELRQVDAAAVRDLVRASAVGAEGLLLRGDAATLVPLLTREGLTPEVLAPPDRRAPGTAR